jgi:hypothetical protein
MIRSSNIVCPLIRNLYMAISTLLTSLVGSLDRRLADMSSPSGGVHRVSSLATPCEIIPQTQSWTGEIHVQ